MYMVKQIPQLVYKTGSTEINCLKLTSTEIFIFSCIQVSRFTNSSFRVWVIIIQCNEVKFEMNFTIKHWYATQNYHDQFVNPNWPWLGPCQKFSWSHYFQPPMHSPVLCDLQ